jgi:Terminase large subunit, T4likevirus-type, N-terminal
VGAADDNSNTVVSSPDRIKEDAAGGVGRNGGKRTKARAARNADKETVAEMAEPSGSDKPEGAKGKDPKALKKGGGKKQSISRKQLLEKAFDAVSRDLEKNERPMNTIDDAMRLLEFDPSSLREKAKPAGRADRVEQAKEPAKEAIKEGGDAEPIARQAYEELPSQRRFHASEARFKGFSGPVGSGKSYALCQEALRMCRLNEGRTGLIGAPTIPMLRDATMRTFSDACEESGERYSVNKSTNTVTLKASNSRVLFRSLDAYERLRGTTLAWFGVDELTYVKEEAWLRLEARLRDPEAKRLCGFGVWTPKGFDWVARRFREEPVEGYALIEAEPFENRHILENTPDYYERLKASYDESFFEQEALGKYVNLQAGRVYYTFERKEHVGAYAVDADEPLLWSWDFNINPMSSVVCQRMRDVVYVVDEIVLKTSSTPEVCEEFLQRYGEHRAGLKVYGDASGSHGNTVTGTSDYQYIRKFLASHRSLKGTVTVAAANPPVRDRINLANARLKNALGERRLFVDRRCKQLVKDFEEVGYKPDSGQIDKDDPARTHLSDALGYLLWQEFGGLGSVGERARRVV